MEDGNDSPNKTETNRKQKRALHVEAVVKESCPTPLSKIRDEVKSLIVDLSLSTYKNGPIDVSSSPLLTKSCTHVCIVDVDEEEDVEEVAFWLVSEILVHAFVLSHEESEVEELISSDDTDEGELPAAELMPIPHATLHDTWDSLIIPKSTKSTLLEYASSALLFSDAQVSDQLIAFNRLLLLYGPPGCGKTSLCRALAHKLSIRIAHRFHHATLLEIHSHSLFSKWFSESGKLVAKLFAQIRDIVETDPDTLLIVLIDEVESLAASRNHNSSSPTAADATRAVNSLLTAVDKLKSFSNLLFLTTTNLTNAVDKAFLDRADFKQYIGFPSLPAIYQILRTAVHELLDTGIIAPPEGQGEEFSLLSYSQLQALGQTPSQENVQLAPSLLLLQASQNATEFSGRSLRKLPLQTHAMFIRSPNPASLKEFLVALDKTVLAEQRSQAQLMKEFT